MVTFLLYFMVLPSTLSQAADIPRILDGEVKSFNEKAGSTGNVIGIQPYLTLEDYSTDENLKQALRIYLDQAVDAGFLNKKGPNKTVVVFPEFVGTYLIVQGAPSEVWNSKHKKEAMKVMFHHFGAKTKLILDGLTSLADPITAGAFLSQRQKMLDAYIDVFGSLAKEYHVMIVAGSITLPKISQKDPDHWKAKLGKLYNTTFVFHANGKPDPRIVRKMHITPEETQFEHNAEPYYPVFHTPAGNMAVLICADSWYPESYQALNHHGVKFLAVPSYVELPKQVQRYWTSFNIFPASDFDQEVRTKVYNHITYDQAWESMSTAGSIPISMFTHKPIDIAPRKRIQSTDIRYAMNPFLRGEFWEETTDGHSIIVKDVVNGVAQFERGTLGKGGGIYNLWLH